MNGLYVQVFRSASGGDCTNGGVSSRFEHVILVADDVPGIFEAREDCPALYVHKRIIGGQEYVHCSPEKDCPGRDQYMFGGNFVYSSDGRFPNRYPIPIHDRRE